MPTSQAYRTLDPGVRRWATFGPWYAMFPVDFALAAVARYSQIGDLVVDPFCGRGTSVFAASALGRKSFGVEINAVGWVYAQTKLAPANLRLVLQRYEDIARRAKRAPLPDLPRFFTRAYAPNVRRFLTAARDMLDWRGSSVDRTAMAMLLLYAHGNRANAFSNQMRQTRSMAPAYALRWWDDRGSKPPSVEPVEFLESRLIWRYAHGFPRFIDARIYHGDSTRVPHRRPAESTWSLLLTSPPYMKMANYHYDQWIRLWLLGGPPHPVVNGGAHQSWFANKESYRGMLASVFSRLAISARRNAVIYVRTDAREQTKRITMSVLKEVFPRKHVTVIVRPLKGASQTVLYNDVTGPGEIDIILR